MNSYDLKWEDDWCGHGAGWVAFFEDGVHVFVTEELADDPELTDRIVRDAHEDIALGDAAPDMRVYEAPREEP